MGIPKYFRYISERWPNISQLVNDSVIPEYDNLYLDMNSILHTCTHKDSDVMHVLTEAEMWVAIFNYIEHLFSVIKPKKVFYMAIDGVAPRAKMNQQRSRRFRSARDAETARRAAIEQGLELPAEEPFDSNAITPGTDFMAKLTVQLKYFINRKISEDTAWQGPRIILSGHEVPGEGEHKIMNFIRSLRSEPGYSHNTRHCLYGLDADLIMLGLSTHEPHFSLLREEVTFGRVSKTQSNELSEKRFFLLHLSLTREYLQLEFDNLLDDSDGATTFDFERILDDFILINFFIGNDFLPELPMLLINEGAIPVILGTYKRYLLQHKVYITENGVINFQNLKAWMGEMAAYQYQKFEAESKDASWFNNELDLISKVRDAPDELVLTPDQRALVREIKPFILNAALADDPQNQSLKVDAGSNAKFVELVAQQTGFHLDDERVLRVENIPADKAKWLAANRKTLRIYERAKVSSTEQDEQRQEVYNQKFNQWRDKYYKFKFGATHDSPEIKDVVQNYLEGLQWVLSYYYRGCPSWSWFYRHHYAPMTVDLIAGISDDFKIEFGPSKPFKPFEQLMGVLPDRSQKLVPPAYRELMTSPQSPIIDFYPNEFELDPNGKKNDWEAVVLIPFIEEKRLLDALATREDRLTEAEIARNQLGSDLEFRYNPQTSFFYPSPLAGLPDLAACQVEVENINPHSADANKLVYGMLDESKSGKSLLAGFPSLETLDYEFAIKKGGVRVFEQESRHESIVLKIQNAFADDAPADLAHRLVNSNVYVGYPLVREAKVVALSTPKEVFRLKNNQVVSGQPDAKDALLWSKQKPLLVRNYTDKGIEVGTVDVLVHYLPLKGLIRKRDGSYIKEFGTADGDELAFPLQLVVEDVEDEDERFKEREAQPIEDEYPTGSKAILLLSKHFGSPVTVTGHQGDSVNVELFVLDAAESSYGSQLAQREKSSDHYFSVRDVADSLKIDSLFMSQITSRFLFTFNKSKYDLGLVLKKPAQNLKALGYARMGFRGWEFSQRGVTLLLAYLRAFPEMLMQLAAAAKKSRNGVPDLASVLPAEAAEPSKLQAKLQAMKKWLRENLEQIQYVPVANEALSPAGVTQVEDWAKQEADKPTKVNQLVVNHLPRGALLAPATAHHQLRRQKFYLGNRVVSALDYGKVPLYARGTVVGINVSPVRVTLDVVFDNEFEAGSLLDKRLQTKRGLTVDAGSVVNLSVKQLVFDKTKNQDEHVGATALPTRHTGFQKQPQAPRGGKQSNNGTVPAPKPRVSAWQPKDLAKPAKAQTPPKAKSQTPPKAKDQKESKQKDQKEPKQKDQKDKQGKRTRGKKEKSPSAASAPSGNESNDLLAAIHASGQGPQVPPGPRGPAVPPQPQGSPAVPPQGYPAYPQGYPAYPPGYPPQGYAPQGFPPQGFPPQGFQGVPPQGFPQGVPPQGFPGYPHPGMIPGYQGVPAGVPSQAAAPGGAAPTAPAAATAAPTEPTKAAPAKEAAQKPKQAAQKPKDAAQKPNETAQKPKEADQKPGVPAAAPAASAPAPAASLLDQFGVQQASHKPHDPKAVSDLLSALKLGGNK